ncbi:MAG: hypothetical protein ACI9LM_004262 [Alteromonadaceae bacterium]|jgi:hypothetical protein
MQLRSLSIFILLFILSGCVSTSKPQDPQVLSKNHGFAFVHFPRVHPSISLKSLSTKKSYDLRYNGENDTASLWLPAGQYELEEVSYSADSLTSKTVKLTGYPKIFIKEAEIINLGSLINFNVGEGKDVWLPIPSKESQLLANAELKKHSLFLRKNAVIQWKPIKLPDINKGRSSGSGLGLIADLGLAYSNRLQEGLLKNKLLAINDIDSFYKVIIKLLPPIIDQEPSYDKTGNLYLGADLGQIKKRTPKGIWTSIDTGTLDSISKVYWYQGSLFAVADDNKILVSKSEDTPWQEYTQVGTNQVIYDLDGINDDLIILSATKERSGNIFILGQDFTLSVNRANYNNAANIHLIKNIEQQGDVFKKPKGVINNGIYYLGLMPDIFTSVNLNTMQWRDIKLPQQFSSFRIAENNVITLLNSQGAFSDLFISENSGDDWQELNTPSYIIQDVFFSDNTNGFAYRISMGVFSVEHILQQFNATKETWHDITQAPQACKYIFAHKIDRPILCLTTSDSMLSFKDNKWTLEVSN